MHASSFVRGICPWQKTGLGAQSYLGTAYLFRSKCSFGLLPVDELEDWTPATTLKSSPVASLVAKGNSLDKSFVLHFLNGNVSRWVQTRTSTHRVGRLVTSMSTTSTKAKPTLDWYTKGGNKIKQSALPESKWITLLLLSYSMLENIEYYSVSCITPTM